MLAVTRAVKEHCADAVAVKADNNHLVRLDWFASLVHAAPDVRALDLTSNDVRLLFDIVQPFYTCHRYRQYIDGAYERTAQVVRLVDH